MYLRKLNREEQKNFLELAYCAANYNDKFADEQKGLINEYRTEMLLDENEYKVQEKKLKDILDFFKGSSKTIKNAVFLEIMALILSDNIYDKKEQEVISIIRDYLEIAGGKHDKAVQWVKDMQDLYGRAEIFVNE
ncbi:MAG: hypothetical protein ACQEQF_05905 [Bacillota bacterium]